MVEAATVTAWALISWSAVTVGLAGTWVAGKHRAGWLIGAAASGLWLGYDIDKAIWAGAFAATVAIVVSGRNWRLGAEAGRR